MNRVMMAVAFGLSLTPFGVAFADGPTSQASGRNNSANDPRPFSLVEDTYAEGAGSMELENTFSYGHRTRSDHGYNAVDIEHEFEFGLTDNFDLKIPVAYHLESSDETDSVHFDSAAIQADIYFTNSFTDPIGIGLIGEVGIGEHSISIETVLILQKDFGNWVIAYNLGAEAEIGGVFDSSEENDTEGTLVNALGIGYAITPTLRLGVQAAAESTYANWSHYEGTVVYAGPVLNYFGGKNWWLTVAPNFLLTNQDDEPNYLLDVIVAFNF